MNEPLSSKRPAKFSIISLYVYLLLIGSQHRRELLSFPNAGVQSLIVYNLLWNIFSKTLQFFSFSKLVINVMSSKSLAVLTLAPELLFEHRVRIKNDCFAIVIIRRADLLTCCQHGCLFSLIYAYGYRRNLENSTQSCVYHDIFYWNLLAFTERVVTYILSCTLFWNAQSSLRLRSPRLVVALLCYIDNVIEINSNDKC